MSFLNHLFPHIFIPAISLQFHAAADTRAMNELVAAYKHHIINEGAPRLNIRRSFSVIHMVNLTTLAPKIVAAILDETVPPDMKLFDLAVDPPALWEEQRNRIKGMMPRSRIESCR